MHRDEEREREGEGGRYYRDRETEGVYPGRERPKLRKIERERGGELRDEK